TTMSTLSNTSALLPTYSQAVLETAKQDFAEDVKEEKTRWTTKQKAYGVGAVLAFLLILIGGVVIFHCSSATPIDIRIRPTGVQMRGYNAVKAREYNGSGEYLRFKMDIRTELCHPGNRIILKAFNTTVYNGDLEMGRFRGGAQSIYTATSQMAEEQAFTTFLYFPLQTTLNGGDYGFSLCAARHDLRLLVKYS
ncbi:hypothetical protein PFISCL1PPCAC_12077, partial [Pristionchus fissidentatus]